MTANSRKHPMQSTTQKLPPAGQIPGVGSDGSGSAFCNDGLLTDEVVRDVWCKLNDRINNVAHMGDPLSKSERELYETMTAWLTLRGKLVVATVSASS